MFFFIYIIPLLLLLFFLLYLFSRCIIFYHSFFFLPPTSQSFIRDIQLFIDIDFPRKYGNRFRFTVCISTCIHTLNSFSFFFFCLPVTYHFSAFPLPNNILCVNTICPITFSFQSFTIFYWYQFLLSSSFSLFSSNPRHVFPVFFVVSHLRNGSFRDSTFPKKSPCPFLKRMFSV